MKRDETQPSSKSIDRWVRRQLLRSLRQKHSLDRKDIGRALDWIDARAAGEELVKRLRAEYRKDRDLGNVWTSETHAKEFVRFASALRHARSISHQQYVFLAMAPVQQIHDARVVEGSYDSELSPIVRAMDAIRIDHGLTDDEDWYLDQAPDEYRRLSDEYSRLLDGKLVELMKEFGLNELAGLKVQKPEAFENAWERGRRTVFHKNEHVLALQDRVEGLEVEARLAASSGLYAAAITLLGAGLEGLLLLRCLKSKAKASKAASALSKADRPSDVKDSTKWRFDTLIKVCQGAGWLTDVSTPFGEYRADRLAHLLRDMRNYVHPGRHTREQPWAEPDNDDYQDALSIYVAVSSSVIPQRSSRLRELETSEQLDLALRVTPAASP